MAQRSSTVRSPAVLDEVAWRVLIDAYLHEAWQFASEAGLDPKTAAEACEITSLRLLERLDGGCVSDPEAPSLSGWIVQTMLAEIRRARRLDSWRHGGDRAAFPDYPSEPADAAAPSRPHRSVTHDRL